METAKLLWDSCTFIDFLFYDFSFTMNQSEIASIRTTIRYISDAPAVIAPDCKSIGHVSFQRDGENIITAEMYAMGKCYAFVFKEDDKPKYGNKFTDQGAQYFGGIVQKGMQMR